MALGKVVVFGTLDFPEAPDSFPEGDVQVVVARYREFNLCAHGHTRHDAVDNLKFHFRHFIEGLRDTGELQKFLDTTGVAWEPYAQARARGVQFEDLSPELNPDESPEHPAAAYALEAQFIQVLPAAA